MTDRRKASGNGVGILSLICLLFVGLKLTGHIMWSWWWVFAPIWGPFAVIITVMGIAVIVFLIWEWSKS